MIEVIAVKRENNKAVQAVIGTGSVEITYILTRNGKLAEIARSSPEKQILDDQSLIVSPADYRQIIRTANAILREKRRKAPMR